MSIPRVPSGLNQLLWFARIVEAGSFAEAARRAGVSTSALSKSLARFEKNYDVRLLHRTTHSLSLTGEGERLLDEARLLMEHLQRAENILQDLGDRGAAGRVRISAPAAFARTCILPHLPDFLASHPQIQIEVQLDDNIANLADRGIDLAIRSGPVDEDAGYVAVELLRFPWVACATPEYLTAHGTPQAPHELLDHAQIGYRNKSTGQIDNWLFSDPGDATPVRYTPCARHVFDDGQAAWSMVCAGLGIAWAPAWLGIDDLRCGRVIEILKPWRAPPSPLFAVRLQRRLTPLRTHQVMQFIASLPAAWQV